MLTSIQPKDLPDNCSVTFEKLPAPISEGLYFLSSVANSEVKESFELLMNDSVFPQLLWTVGSHVHGEGFAFNAHFALHYASKLQELVGLKYAVVCTRLYDSLSEVNKDPMLAWQTQLNVLRSSVVVPPRRNPSLRFKIIVLGVEPSASFVGK